MKFNLVDIKNWKRKEHFEHYMNQVRCSYSLVVHIDITRFRQILKESHLKDYPAQIYVLARAVNNLPEFRMGLNKEGHLGYWDVVNPVYTVLNKETETFSSIWTDYNSLFHEFYDNCIDDINNFCTGSFAPKSNCPENAFSISSTPWIDFTAFNINVFSDGIYLPPIFTIGKYMENNGKIVMPLAIQVHHAVCDGFHIGKFVENIKLLINQCEQWLHKR